MITDVDAALRTLLRTALPDDVKVSHAIGEPGVAIVLYDVREDVDARVSSWRDRHDEHGRVVARTPPVRRYLLRYLVIAQASTVDEEHAWLTAVLTGFAWHRTLPGQHLGEPLRDVGLPIEVAPPNLTPVPADWWTSHGLRPTCALDVVVNAPCLLPETTALTTRPDTVELGVAQVRPARTPNRSTAIRPRRRISEHNDGR